MVVVTIKKDDVVRWKQCVKHCGGYYYCLNMSIEHIRKDLIKLGALALSVAINRRGRERTGWALLTLVLQNQPQNFLVFGGIPTHSRWRVHSASLLAKELSLAKVSDVTTSVPVSVGVLMEKRRSAFSWETSGKLFQLGIEMGSELWFKQLMGVN